MSFQNDNTYLNHKKNGYCFIEYIANIIYNLLQTKIIIFQLETRGILYKRVQEYRIFGEKIKLPVNYFTLFIKNQPYALFFVQYRFQPKMYAYQHMKQSIVLQMLIYQLRTYNQLYFIKVFMTEIEQKSPLEQAKKEPKNNNKLEVTQEETSNFLYNKNCAKSKHPQQICLEKQGQQIPEIKQEQQDRFAFYKGNFIKESPQEEQMSEESQFKAQLSCQSDQEKNSQQRREGYNNHSSKKRKRKTTQRSAHHNSQKHAVVTIKTMVQFYYDGQKSVSSEAAQQIWKSFMQTRRKNKAILNILFGTRGDNPKQLQQLLSQYNFKQLLNYSYQQIKQAQKILREMVINQITSDTLNNNLKNRRIANKNQFRQYMVNFVEDLKQGPIRRRILKEVSSKISQLALVGEYIQ